MRLLGRVLLGWAAVGLMVSGAAWAEGVKVVSRESMGRMPTEGTVDFRLVANKDLSKVAVMDRWGAEKKWYVVQNSLVWEFYTEMDAASAQFTPDGAHLTLLAQHDEGWFLIRENKDIRALGKEACRGLALSADGKHDACVQVVEGGQRVLRDGKAVAAEGAPAVFEEIAGLVFGADGRLVFNGRSGGKAYVVAEGKLLGSVAANRVLPVVFSGDGKHVVCGAAMQDGAGTRIMRLVDGEVAKTYRTPQAGTEVSGLTQSADGEHVAWGEKDVGGNRLMVDGEKRDDIVGKIRRMVLSADGKHVAWLGESSSFVVLVLDKTTWNLADAMADAALSLSDKGPVVHCVGKAKRVDYVLEKDKWMPNGVASSGAGGVSVHVDGRTMLVNGSPVEQGQFLEARAGDSQMAYILTQNELPMYVNDKKLGEITRTVVKLERGVPAGK